MPYTFDRYLNIRSALNPVLSPDGRRVAYLSDVSGSFQVWSVGLGSEPDERWPIQLTFFADKVWDIHGTPAADHLIAVSDVGGNERQQLYLIANYGVTNDGADGDDQQRHNVRRLTTDDEAIHRFGAWSSDGQSIIYTSNARNGVDFDLYWMELHSGAGRLIAETSGNRAVAAWSPDGAAVLMVDALASEEIELYLIDMESGEERRLTAGQHAARYHAIQWTDNGIFALCDRARDRFAICRLSLTDASLEEIVAAEDVLTQAALGDGELDLLVVDGEGAAAIVTANIEGYSHLFRLNLADGSWRRIEGVPAGLITSMRFSPDGQQIVLDLQGPQRNPDIWTVDLVGGAVRRQTFSNRAGIDARTLVVPELIHFTTFDGLQIPAFFYRPQRPAPADGYPCILYVHGGPASQQRPDFDVRFQYFLGQGYAILAPNVRGSTGYGRSAMMMDDVEKRMESVADLRHAVLWLHEQPEIADDRIAVYGRSYGGFMVLAALTEYPEFFAAGIDVVGISDWVTFLERTSRWRRAHREREYGSLAEHRELLASMSPIHKAARIQMPLMVLAGDNDPRVPLYESERIVERVRDAGGSVEFVHYADEGHRFSKLSNRVDSFTRMAAFLDRTLAP